jgi:hypothetical protein
MRKLGRDHCHFCDDFIPEDSCHEPEVQTQLEKPSIETSPKEKRREEGIPAKTRA